MWRRLPLYWKILLGMFAGVLIGIAAVAAGADWLVRDWVKPFSVIFLNFPADRRSSHLPSLVTASGLKDIS